MASVKDCATDQERRVFSWACESVGHPCTHLFESAPADVNEDVARGMCEMMRQLVDGKQNGVVLEVLSSDPVPVVLIPNSVPQEDGAALIRLADDEGLWAESTIVTFGAASGSFNQGAVEQVRTSATATLNYPRHERHPVVLRMRRWAASLFGVPESFVEPLQIVR
mmetsp:Transcript_129893/g.415468  ORF Transcript_129893/g.415468 Transcript_129893/m.415468 type:complete len:166 (+) Transcript_129893:335-832(+)